MRPAPQPPLPATRTAPPAAPFALPSPAASATALGRDFEAAMLAPLVEAMLPPEGGAAWGEGGAIWRGLFAAELAGEIARAGGVGLASTVDGLVAGRREGRP